MIPISAKEREILPVLLLVEGPLAPVSVQLVPIDQKIIYPPEAEEYIEAAWQERGRRYPDRPLRDTPTTLMTAINPIGGSRWEISTVKSSYKYRNGTPSPEFRKEFGDKLVAKTIGADAMVLTGDQYILVGQRNTPRPGKTGGLHIIGGMVENNLLLPTVLREAKEETGIEPNEWQPISILGISQSKETLAISVAFLGTTELTKKQIAVKETDGELGLKFVPNTPDEVRRLLLHFLRTASSSSVAALYLYGKQNFSLHWADSILERIELRNAAYSQLNEVQQRNHMEKLERRLFRL